MEIRDQLIFGQNLQILSIKCYLCNESSHTAKFCNKIQYIPHPQTVVSNNKLQLMKRKQITRFMSRRIKSLLIINNLKQTSQKLIQKYGGEMEGLEKQDSQQENCDADSQESEIGSDSYQSSQNFSIQHKRDSQDFDQQEGQANQQNTDMNNFQLQENDQLQNSIEYEETKNTRREDRSYSLNQNLINLKEIKEIQESLDIEEDEIDAYKRKKRQTSENQKSSKFTQNYSFQERRSDKNNITGNNEDESDLMDNFVPIQQSNTKTAKAKQTSKQQISTPMLDAEQEIIVQNNDPILNVRDQKIQSTSNFNLNNLLFDSPESQMNLTQSNIQKFEQQLENLENVEFQPTLSGGPFLNHNSYNMTSNIQANQQAIKQAKHLQKNSQILPASQPYNPKITTIQEIQDNLNKLMMQIVGAGPQGMGGLSDSMIQSPLTGLLQSKFQRDLYLDGDKQKEKQQQQSQVEDDVDPLESFDRYFESDNYFVKNNLGEVIKKLNKRAKYKLKKYAKKYKTNIRESYNPQLAQTYTLKQQIQ